LATLVAAIVTAAVTALAEEAPSHAGHAFPAQVHYLLNERLQGGPFIIIGDFQHFFHAVHHALLELRGVKVSTAAAVVLGQSPAGSKASHGGHARQRDPSIHFAHIISDPLQVRVCRCGAAQTIPLFNWHIAIDVPSGF
jgi:hypothetical protein